MRTIFDAGEVNEKAVCRNFRHIAADCKEYESIFYNLDAIISVGYRVNSPKAMQFRQWATGVLRDFSIKGYVLDKARLENGSFLGEQYFDRLLDEIREIRLSERKFYQKITHIYATSLDYSKDVEALARVVGMYLDHAEDMATRKIPMTMADWAVRLDAFLQFNQRDVLDDFGKVSMEVAKSFALSEFEQYRVVQDRLFQSDFDKLLFDSLKN